MLLKENLPSSIWRKTSSHYFYVEDHARALTKVIEKGVIGETYNIGSHCEKTNLEVVKYDMIY